MYTQYRVKDNKIDLVFPKSKRGIKIDEYGHVDIDPDCEKKTRINKRSWFFCY